jgi:D-amino peptidase
LALFITTNNGKDNNMKIYISADIEGITGVTHWDEATKTSPDFIEFQRQMTAEVNAACDGALAAGAKELYIKDAHATGRNLIVEELPQEAKLIRGWSEHPFSMVQELDETFDAVLMIGYHSRAGSDGNPLAHTISGKASSIKINDLYASEFLIHAYAAALVAVPVIFLSGDEGICSEAKALIPEISTLAVKKGVGDSTISIHPQLAIARTRQIVEDALQGNLKACLIDLPEYFEVEITFKEHALANHASFYPGASLKAPHIVTFETDEYFEVLRLLSFIL